MHKGTEKCLSPEHLRSCSLAYVVSLAQTYENSTGLDVSCVNIAENSSQVLTIPWYQCHREGQEVRAQGSLFTWGASLSITGTRDIWGTHRHLCSDSLKLKPFFKVWWQEICMSFSLGKNVTITVSNFKQKIHFPPSSLIRSSLFEKLEGMQDSSEFTWSLESTF